MGNNSCQSSKRREQDREQDKWKVAAAAVNKVLFHTGVYVILGDKYNRTFKRNNKENSINKREQAAKEQSSINVCMYM